MSKKGFITIATGKEEYYELALNLLHSYHHFCDNPYPFAILCDRRNRYTEEFDDVILFNCGATNSYLDKLSLGEYVPYDETIFIDADCLAYGNLNVLFELFTNADDFSCFGRILPLNDKTGWFEYDNLGELKNEVSYIVGLHGGIYFMRRGEVIAKVCNDAKRYAKDYSRYKFKGKFDTPGDEPVIALSMAVNNCHPIPHDLGAICCYWEHDNNVSIDISKGVARLLEPININSILIHWGTRNTRELLYKIQVKVLNVLESNEPNKELKIKRIHFRYKVESAWNSTERLVRRVIAKIKRVIGAK